MLHVSGKEELRCHSPQTDEAWVKPECHVTFKCSSPDQCVTLMRNEKGEEMGTSSPFYLKRTIFCKQCNTRSEGRISRTLTEKNILLHLIQTRTEV